MGTSITCCSVFSLFTRRTILTCNSSITSFALSARADDYDAILIPGGLFSPDKLRTEKDALRFASSFVNQRKPVFAICHGPQVLISAGAAKDRRMTGVKSIQKDLANAGADVSDEAVVVDDGLVTSRTPDDLDAFNAKIVEEMTETKHDRHQKHFGFAFF